MKPSQSQTQQQTSVGQQQLAMIQVGLGGWGRNWYQLELRNHPSARVAAWVDADKSARTQSISSFSLPSEQVYADLDDALEHHAAEAVLVTTSLAGHVPVVERALRAGRHVLVEKPFAPSVAEAERLVELAEKVGKILMVSQNYRFFPAPVAARELVTSGNLGALGAIHVDFRRDHVRPDPGRKTHELLSQPLLADMAIHHFDLMRMVTGQDAKRITCHGWNPPWSAYKDPAAAVAFVEMEDGLPISYRGSWVSPGSVTPWAGEWHMEFERGEAVWTSRIDMTDTADRLLIAEHGKQPKEQKLPTLSQIGRSGAVEAFVAAIQSGTSNGCAGSANIGSLAMTYAAIASVECGEPVDVTGRSSKQ